MSYVNFVLNSFFDLIVNPFKDIAPIWSLTLFSFLIAILMLLIFRYTSNQTKIKETKSKIRAYIYELTLFKDELGIVLSAQKNVLIQNLKYIKYAVKPMIFMIIPLGLFLIQLDSLYGHKPLDLNESTIVSLKLSDKTKMPENISVKSDGGLTIETSPLKIVQDKQVDWRVRADEIGEHDLIFKVEDQEYQKKVIVGNQGIMRIIPTVSTPNFWNNLLYPGGKLLAKGGAVEEIHVDYKRSSIGVYKWKLDWLVVIFGLSIVFAFGMKGLFKVEI
ncbi:MAG: hypothetical protein WBA70_12590 [Thermodesulfobacteriota bacterium]